MNKKSVIAFILSMTLFSISISAAVQQSAASASSNSASASVTTTTYEDLLARAKLEDHTNILNDTDEGYQKRASASVSSDGVSWTPTLAYATAWVGNTEVRYDRWPD